MTETPTPEPRKSNNFWIDFGPVAIFVGAYHYLRRSDPDGAMLTAAGIFMVVAVIALAYSRVKTGKFSGMLLLTTAIIVVTAGLAIFSGNKTIFYMKPTIVNILFGIGVLGGVLLKKNVIKMLMGEAIELPDVAWTKLAVRWGVFFFVLAAINEYVWRNYSEEFWVNFKLFGFMPITILFTLTQIPFIMKNGKVRGVE
ncbi:MAG: inner membrane-spanning protein YciB [Maricaulaceae bacterium]